MLICPSADSVVREFLKKLQSRASIESAIRWEVAAAKVDDRSASPWTNALLNVLADMGKERGFTVLPEGYLLSRTGRNKKYAVKSGKLVGEGEYMLDLVWGHWGKTQSWWKEDLSAVRPGIDLACESEWWGGDENKLSDYCKLCDVKARVKIFLASVTKGKQDAFLTTAKEIAMNARHRTPGEEYAILLWAPSAEWASDRSTPNLLSFRTP